ncbi:MAG TPA: serine/threonine-protein kinase [Polyangiaceae bacterium]
MSEGPVPRRLGQYEIVRRLAYGGMAEVFLGKLRGVDGFAKDVVIKRVLPQHATNVEFMMMFRDEARITARLHHGNIVQVVEFGEAEGQHYLVLEYVNGPSLGMALSALGKKGGRLSIAEVAHVGAEVARALDYAHRKRATDGTSLQIVHRDVTPSNILLSREGEVKLADFGIARARARLAETVGGEGALKGKIAYMAPESIRSGQADARSDVFALGAVLFQMLTGTHAFRADNEAATIANILLHAPPRPSGVNASIPAVIDELVLSMLAPDPERRPARALVVAETLARALPVSEPPAEMLARTLAQLFPDLRPRESEQPPTIASASARQRVLIVDESRTVRAVLRAALSVHYLVTEAASAEEALRVLRETPTLGVLCQRTLNAGAGLELCRHIRADPALAKVAFVLLASEESAELRAEAEAAGAQAVVRRSVDALQLEEILRRFASGNPSP